MSLYQKRNLSSVAASLQRWRQSHFWGVTSCWHNMGGNTKKAWHEKEFHSGCVGIWVASKVMFPWCHTHRSPDFHAERSFQATKKTILFFKNKHQCE